MSDPSIPDFRPVTRPRAMHFRIELRWTGPPMNPTSLFIAQKMVEAYAPLDAPRVKVTNEDFAVTFTCDHHRLAQLLNCLGILRAHRIRFAAFTEGEPIDDVTERLEDSVEWSYYPTVERVDDTQQALATKPRKTTG